MIYIDGLAELVVFLYVPRTIIVGPNMTVAANWLEGRIPR
jgi:hypothetical protein